MSSRYNPIYEIIRLIPIGRVATYGQIARLAGIPGRARQVGYALHCLPEGADVPWHRVVNEKGCISLSPERSGLLQQAMLQDEGVGFDSEGVIPLEIFRWQE